MAVSPKILAVGLSSLEPGEAQPSRRYTRDENVRIVEYTPFPRLAPDQHPRIGFTRDLSDGGMCIGVDDPEPIGALLRVTLLGVDGCPGRHCVERVVWRSQARDGRHWLGLERLTYNETI